MGRRRKAWLSGGTGVRRDRGKRLPGWYVEWNEYHLSGRRRHRTRQFASAQAARRFARRFNARMDLDIGDVVPATVEELVEEFLAGLSGISRDHRQDYMVALGKLAAVCGDEPVSAVGGREIDKIIGLILKAGRRPMTARKYVGLIRRFFRWCVDRGYAVEDPTKRATTIPQLRARQRPAITDADIGRLLSVLDTEDRRLAVLLAITTGLDRSVIRNLTARQVDLENRCLTVIRPKTGKMLRLHLHAGLHRAIRERCEATPAGRPLLAGLDRQREGHDWWTKAIEKAKLPGLLFRDLRAVAAMKLGAALGLSGAQRALGHASPTTTMAHYYLPDPGTPERIDSIPLPTFPGRPSSRPR